MVLENFSKKELPNSYKNYPKKIKEIHILKMKLLQEEQLLIMNVAMKEMKRTG